MKNLELNQKETDILIESLFLLKENLSYKKGEDLKLLNLTEHNFKRWFAEHQKTKTEYFRKCDIIKSLINQLTEGN